MFALPRDATSVVMAEAGEAPPTLLTLRVGLDAEDKLSVDAGGLDCRVKCVVRPCKCSVSNDATAGGGDADACLRGCSDLSLVMGVAGSPLPTLSSSSLGKLATSALARLVTAAAQEEVPEEDAWAVAWAGDVACTGVLAPALPGAAAAAGGPCSEALDCFTGVTNPDPEGGPRTGRCDWCCGDG
jgi:hypothetical protein